MFASVLSLYWNNIISQTHKIIEYIVWSFRFGLWSGAVDLHLMKGLRHYFTWKIHSASYSPELGSIHSNIRTFILLPCFLSSCCVPLSTCLHCYYDNQSLCLTMSKNTHLMRSLINYKDDGSRWLSLLYFSLRGQLFLVHFVVTVCCHSRCQ